MYENMQFEVALPFLFDFVTMFFAMACTLFSGTQECYIQVL